MVAKAGAGKDIFRWKMRQQQGKDTNKPEISSDSSRNGNLGGGGAVGIETVAAERTATAAQTVAEAAADTAADVETAAAECNGKPKC